METRPFNDNSFGLFIKEEKIMGSKCRKCGALGLPPRQICIHCHSTDAEWIELDGSGLLIGFTSVVVAPPIMMQKGFSRKNPYLVGVVELENRLKMVARIIGDDANRPEDIKVGMPVKVDFETATRAADEKPCLYFRLLG